MSEPVTVAETALLARDQDRQPWQHALVLTLAGGLTRAELVGRLAERITFAPRFRRVVAGWPVAGWVDDVNFNLAGHVGEVTLGRDERLEDWLELQLATALPRSHPLWAATLVNDPQRGSQAVVVRVHPALVDGYANIHLFQEALDEEPEDVAAAPDDWAASETTPPVITDLLDGLDDPVGAARQAVAGVFGFFENGLRGLVAQSRPQHLAAAEVDLPAVLGVRDAFGCTTHDVLLTLATAGVRGWLVEHGRPIEDVTALVPLAIAEPQVLDSAIGCRIAPSFDLLPVAAADPVERLQAIATITRARRDSGVSVPARDLVDLAGFAPATLGAVAAGTVAAGRSHTVVVSNVPGPREPRYLGRARVRQVYAVTATTDTEDLSVTVTSYRGRVTLSVAAVEVADSWGAEHQRGTRCAERCCAMSLVFVPMSAAELGAWAAAGRLAGPAAAHAVTSGLVAAFGADDPEDAERTALLVASIAALARTGVRLVAVAEAPAQLRPDGDADFGEVLVADLPFGAVTSLFADDDDLDVSAPATASAGLPLAEAWELPAVTALLADADLLWYGPAEWAVLGGLLSAVGYN